MEPDRFITLSYPQDLTRAGLEYAFRSLAFGRVSSSPDDLRRSIAVRSTDLALRRYFDERNMPYGLAYVSDPLAPQLILNGKRLVLDVTVVHDRYEIRKILHHPEVLLEYEAHLPEEEALPEDDLIVQAFALALIASSEEETSKAQKAGQPVCLVRPLPLTWAQNHGGSGLGKPVLKSEAVAPVDLELGGTDENLDYQTCQLTLIPMERHEVPHFYQSIAYMQVFRPVQGRIAVRCPVLNETITANPLDWHNLWIYGMNIVITGALTVREMRRLMTLNLRKSSANQKIKIAEIKPLASYFA